jgi:predicted nuclease of predicted toxin-antitoxin system
MKLLLDENLPPRVVQAIYSLPWFGSRSRRGIGSSR